MNNTSFDKNWEGVHKTRVWGEYPSEDVIRFIARNYYSKNRQETRILDFGCGAGANTWYLAKEGFDVYAFDGSESAVTRTIDKLKQMGLCADVKVSDALSTQYPHDFFDCVVDAATITANTLNNSRAMYREVYRILKQGGKFLSTGLFTPNTTGYGRGVCLEKNTYQNIDIGPLAGPTTKHFFEQGEISDIITESGFKNITIDTISRTENGGKVLIESFLVSAEK